MNPAYSLVEAAAKRIVASNDPVAEFHRQPLTVPRTRDITLADAIAVRNEALQRYGAAQKKLAEAKIYRDNAAASAFLVGFAATYAAMEMRRARNGQTPAK